MAKHLPAQSSVIWWHVLPETILHSVIGPLEIVILMTASALIVAVLQLAPHPISRTVGYVCAGIGLLGLITISVQIYKQFRVDMARKSINGLLAEGQRLTAFIAASNPDPKNVRDYPATKDRDQYALMENWCKRVEDALERYTDDGEGYRSRFHFGGSLEQDEQYMSIWKMRHRLETLATFLPELKP